MENGLEREPIKRGIKGMEKGGKNIL